MPHFVDTHCHLNHAHFDVDRDRVLARARSVGVRQLVLIGYDLASSRRAAELADPHAGLYATLGIHPHAAEEWNSDAEAELRALASRPGVVAIGEIGLDFYRNLSPVEAQYASFHAQLALAGELGLPFVTHTRESVTPALDLLEPYAGQGLRGIMHCWSGTLQEARRAWEMGLSLGIGGVLTYKKPGALPEVVRDAPAEALLLETDCPYLPPVPHRGQRNEPSYLPLVALKLAELRGVTPQEIGRVTTDNAARVLGLSVEQE